MNAQTLFDKIKDIKFGNRKPLTLEDCEKMIPLIEEIETLKKEKDAVVLAHTYVPPEILYTVADHTGDSYQLSKIAKEAKEKTIVFSSVRFMGETAKILNPKKTVLIPGSDPRCSLADSITAEEVARLKAENPDYSFICYINSTAEVKAMCEATVTSGNVFHIMETFPSDKIYFIPDRLMGANIVEYLKKKGINKDVKYSTGACHVHEGFVLEEVKAFKKDVPEGIILAHPECGPEFLALADYVGSTAGLLGYMKKADKDIPYLILTEYGLINRLEAEVHSFDFHCPCRECEYMKANTLEDIRDALRSPRADQVVTLDEDVRVKALKAIEKMFELAAGSLMETDAALAMMKKLSRSSRGYGDFKPETWHENASCGDRVGFRFALKGGEIASLDYTGDGCSLALASAAILVSGLKGMKAEEALKKSKALIKAIETSQVSGNSAFSEEEQALLALSQFQGRQKCLLLPWEGIKEELKGRLA